eukprot:scaffold60878_cov31-Prasinocladus_malaysianus.AAC.1
MPWLQGAWQESSFTCNHVIQTIAVTLRPKRQICNLFYDFHSAGRKHNYLWAYFCRPNLTDSMQLSSLQD